MGNAPTSGYCTNVLEAAYPSQLTFLTFVTVPPSLIFLALLYSLCPACAAKRAAGAVCQRFDIRPPIEYDEDERKFVRKSKSTSGGFVTLCLLALYAVLVYFFYTQSMQMSIVRVQENYQGQTSVAMELSMKTEIPCPGAATLCDSSIELVGNYTYNVLCVASNEVCHLTWNVSYPGDLEKLYYTVVFPKEILYEDEDKATDVTLVATSLIRGKYPNNTAFFRQFDAAHSQQELLTFADHCFMTTRVDVRSVTTVTTDAQLRRRCRIGLGPRFICNTDLDAGVFNDIAVAFNPEAHISDSSATQGRGSLEFVVDMRSPYQLNTAVESPQILTLLPRLMGMLGLVVALQQHLRAAITAALHDISRRYTKGEGAGYKTGIQFALFTSLAFWSYAFLAYLAFISSRVSLFALPTPTYTESGSPFGLTGLDDAMAGLIAMGVADLVVLLGSLVFGLAYLTRGPRPANASSLLVQDEVGESPAIQ